MLVHLHARFSIYAYIRFLILALVQTFDLYTNGGLFLKMTDLDLSVKTSSSFMSQGLVLKCMSYVTSIVQLFGVVELKYIR